MAKVLVVGGAGYVGSACSAWLIDRGHSVWILDDLSTGHEELILSSKFTRSRAGDRSAVLPLLKKENFDAVMHFAAKALVAESVENPDIYFENNVDQTRALLEMMHEAGTRRFVFSSTCAVFGDPGQAKMTETLTKKPMNPYGKSKLEVEKILAEKANSDGLRSVALRYFNVAGTEHRLRVGEIHDSETHLIPCILQAALASKPVSIFGTDYSTADGTAVRDYVHVWDLAVTHGAALERVLKDTKSGFESFNLGTEKGYSVRQVIDTCKKVTGLDLKVMEMKRRPGDPPELVADSTLARRELGYQPRENLTAIVRSAWQWQLKRAVKNKAVFLDRDGTLNEDPGYLSEPSQMKLLPSVGEALAKLQDAGFLLVVVSNQSGVGRGKIDPKKMPLIHARMEELLAPQGVRINRYELCHHRPEDQCDCRKPKPKLILDAAKALGVDLSQSFVVGDKATDLVSGRKAACKGVALVRTGEGKNTELTLKPGEADFVGAALDEVADWILRQER